MDLLESKLEANLEQQKVLRDKLKALELEEKRMWMELGVVNTNLTQNEAAVIQDTIIAVMEERRNIGGYWSTPSTIANVVSMRLKGATDDQVRVQLRSMADDESGPVRHNGKRGKASRYCLMRPGDELPPPKANEIREIAVRVLRECRKQGMFAVPFDNLVTYMEVADAGLKLVEAEEVRKELDAMCRDVTTGVKRTNGAYLYLFK